MTTHLVPNRPCWLSVLWRTLVTAPSPLALSLSTSPPHPHQMVALTPRHHRYPMMLSSREQDRLLDFRKQPFANLSGCNHLIGPNHPSLLSSDSWSEMINI